MKWARWGWIGVVAAGLTGLGLARASQPGAALGPAPSVLAFSVAPAPAPAAVLVAQELASAGDGTVLVVDSAANRVQRFDARGTLVSVWGVGGRAEGQLRFPNDVLVLPAGSPYAGDVLVADLGNHRLQRFSPDGRFRELWPVGEMRPALVSPSIVTAGPDGTVFVADSQLGSTRISVLSPDGGWLREVPATWHNTFVHSMAVAADGTLLVGSTPLTASGSILRFTADGTPLSPWPLPANLAGNVVVPWDLGIAADGTVIVMANRGALLRYGTEGQLLHTARPGPGFHAMTVTESDELLVLAGRAFSRLDEAFGVIGGWEAPAGERFLPWDLAAGPSEWVYAVDSASDRIVQLDMDGRFVGRWGAAGGDEPLGAGGIAMAPDGTIVVSRRSAQLLQRHDAHGRPLGVLADPCAGLNSPGAVAVAADGSVVVADTANRRALRYSPSGSLLGSWGGSGSGQGQFAGALQSIAITPGNDVWVLEGEEHAQRYSLGGDFLARRGGPGSRLGQLRAAADLAAAADGTLHLLDAGNGRVQRWAVDGQALDAWEVPPTLANDLGFDAEGRAWLSGGDSGLLSVYADRPADTWRLETFGDAQLTGWPRFITRTARVAFAGKDGAADPGLPAAGHSARLTRTFWSPGEYRLRLRATGGVRLWVGDRLLVDQWPGGSVVLSTAISLPAAATTVQLDYVRRGPGATLELDLTPEGVVTPPPTRTPSPIPSVTPPRTPSSTPRPVFPARRLFVPWLVRDTAEGEPYLPLRPATAGPPQATHTPGAKRLPWADDGLIDVQHYDVALDVADLRADVSARAELRLLVRQATTRVFLDAEPSSVFVRGVREGGAWRPAEWTGGGSAHPTLTGTRLSVDLRRRVDAGEVITLTVDYWLPASTFNRERGLSRLATDYGRPILETVSWPYFTRYWLPSHDTLADPATFSATLRVPEGQLGAANGRLVEGAYADGSGIDESGRRVFRWATERTMPPSSFHVVVGPFRPVVEDICHDEGPPSPRLLPCADAAHRTTVVHFKALGSSFSWIDKQEHDRLAGAVAWLGRAFGPFPADKLGIVDTSHPFDMEYPSLIAARARDAATWGAVHHWWGNSVRIARWEDLWLTEGLTNYLTGLHDEARTGNSSACFKRPGALMKGASFDPAKYLTDDTAFCKGAAAWRDLRRRLASAAGWAPRDERAGTLLLAVLDVIYDRYTGQGLDTPTLLTELPGAMVAGFGRLDRPLDAAMAQRITAAWSKTWLATETALDTAVVATWAGGERRFEALEGNDWLPQLAALGPVTAPLAWYGRACGEAPEQDVAGRVALVLLSGCAVEQKLAAAEARGAVAVALIATARPTDSPSCSARCAQAPGLPAVVVPGADGEALKALLLAGTAVTVTLADPATLPAP